MPNLGTTKWGPSPVFGTDGGIVTWSLVAGGVSGVQDTFDDSFGPSPFSNSTRAANSVLNFNPVAVLREAFAGWSAVANIEFVQVRDGGEQVGRGVSADIRIAFGEIDGAFGDTLGLAFFPGQGRVSGDILFDSEETRFFSDRDNFLSVAAHEIGHSIGLEHISGIRALMNPTVGDTTVPLADDIEGAQRIYGVQDGVASFISLAGGPRDLKLLEALEGAEVRGSNAGNRIDGTEAAETFKGGGGSDILIGRGGDDRLLGGGFADTINGGAGSDTLAGGNGGDRLVAAGDADRVAGGAGSDTVFGGGGNDALFGGGGADLMAGGVGGDTLIGAGGADRLSGGGGDDRLSGGGDNDLLTGGLGADRFVFAANGGADRVRDFGRGADALDLSRLPGIDGVDDLRIFSSGGDAVIHTGQGTGIRLLGVDAASLGADDFIF